MLNSNTFETDKGNTSFAQYRQRSFKYKIFSDELPTLSRLKRRRPDLYPSDTCLSCSQSSETQLHFWSCPSHQAQWINTLNRAADLLMQLFRHSTFRNLPTLDQIITCLHESHTFISKGIVPSAFYNFVQDALRSIPLTNIAIARVYNFIFQQVFTHIWKPRCVTVIVYE